jgi:hypothetical protein
MIEGDDSQDSQSIGYLESILLGNAEANDMPDIISDYAAEKTM